MVFSDPSNEIWSHNRLDVRVFFNNNNNKKSIANHHLVISGHFIEIYVSCQKRIAVAVSGFSSPVSLVSQILPIYHCVPRPPYTKILKLFKKSGKGQYNFLCFECFKYQIYQTFSLWSSALRTLSTLWLGLQNRPFFLILYMLQAWLSKTILFMWFFVQW